MKITHFGQPVRPSRLDRVRNAKGTNQYAVRKRERKDVTTQWLIVFLAIFITLGFVSAGVKYLINQGVNQAYAKVELISPVVREITPTPTQTNKQIQDQEEIENYIKIIFKEDARIAIAVSRNECNPANKFYPKCRFTTPHEDSVGIFQINLQSNAGKVHYDRIPGDNLEEKVEWLKEPKNNVLAAFWIFTHSGWNPWTAYTSGVYLKDM